MSMAMHLYRHTLRAHAYTNIQALNTANSKQTTDFAKVNWSNFDHLHFLSSM